MNIAFFGSSLVSAYWNGAATYYRGMIRALHALGHRTTFFEPDAFERQAHRDLADPGWARVVVYPATEAGVAGALAGARGADLVVKASGVGVFDALLEEEVLALGGPGRLVAFWDVDAAATLERVAGDGADPFRALISRYDLVLTYGGGEPVVRGYTALGARRCVPVYNALDPDLHFPVAPDARFAGDLGFLGNRLPDREARVDEFFFGAAERLSHEDTGRWRATLRPDGRSVKEGSSAFRPDGRNVKEGSSAFEGSRAGYPRAGVEGIRERAKGNPDDVPVGKWVCVLGGNGWGDKGLPEPVRYVGHVYTRDHNAFNCSCRAVLNIARESMARYGFSPATRVFEAAGAGACVISDAWEGMELFLEPGREVLVARDGAEVADLVAGLSAERARAIGEAARQRVLAEHTYAHRAAQLEEVLGLR